MNKIELLNENEQLYLGSIILEPHLLDEARLLPSNFRNPRHQAIFQAMKDLKAEGEPIDLITLAELGESFIENVGGISYLQSLADGVPSTAAFSRYEDNIRSFYTVQRGVNVVQEFLEATRETHSLRNLQKLIQNIMKLEIETVKKRMTFKEMVLNRVMQHHEPQTEDFPGIDTGFDNLNALTQGWQKSDLIILGARPSMGKTALVLNIIAKTLVKGVKVKVIFFSLEMAEEQIIDRLIAILTGIDLFRVKNPQKYFDKKMWDAHAYAVGLMEKFDFEIADEVTVAEQRAVLRRSIRENPEHEHLVAIDYLTLIRSSDRKDNKNSEVEDIVLDLKQMARDFKTPVIVLSQLSRNVEMRNDKRPVLSDLRDSGSIEQAADLVMFLYRDEYYNPYYSESKGLAELIVAKHRNGPIGKLWFKFEKESNKFIDLADTDIA